MVALEFLRHQECFQQFAVGEPREALQSLFIFESTKTLRGHVPFRLFLTLLSSPGGRREQTARETLVVNMTPPVGFLGDELLLE